MNGQLCTAQDARNFIQAGNATVTLVSRATGQRFTYKIQAPFKPDGTTRDLNSKMRFVKVLTGADNEANYSYLGYIRTQGAGPVFFHGGTKARVGREAPSAVAFQWAWRALANDVLPPALEVWHEGRCGRCARKLTVPSSIASGFGPECAERVGFLAEAC